MNHPSFWQLKHTEEESVHSAVPAASKSDMIVVGSGIAGLTTAYLLQKEGLQITLIDKSCFGTGDTGRTTAHLTVMLDTRYSDLLSEHGESAARAVLQSKAKALSFLDSLTYEIGADCDFKRVPGYLFTEDESQVETLVSEREAWNELDLASLWEIRVPLPFAIRGALRVDGQAQFQPLKYLRALLTAFQRLGGVFAENAQVTEIDEQEKCTVRTTRGTFVAPRIAVCTHVPIDSMFSIQTKIAAYRTYAMAVKVSYPVSDTMGLFWDIASPYHYLRAVQSEGETLLVIGGEDHKTGIPDRTGEHASIAALRKYVNERFQVEKVVSEWSGQVHEPVDGLPYIGSRASKSNVFIATGFAGNGMTFGTLSGLLIRDEVLGKENPWREIYAPSRLPSLRHTVEYLNENKDFPVHLIKDRLKGQEQMKDIACGEGGIVRSGAHFAAIYRTPQGDTISMDARCPHLGCLVQWNQYEKSWDCPCHGSRFSCDGKLLNGPACNNLKSFGDRLGNESKSA